MKKIGSLLATILLAYVTYAQTIPQAVNYQAIARDANGSPILNRTVCVRFTINFGINPGVPEYQETQTVTTTGIGLFVVKIGEGAPTIGTFPGIQWATFNKYLLVEYDPNCGGNVNNANWLN